MNHYHDHYVVKQYSNCYVYPHNYTLYITHVPITHVPMYPCNHVPIIHVPCFHNSSRSNILIAIATLSSAVHVRVM